MPRDPIDPETGLTERQSNFVDHYSQFVDPQAAAIAAGYKPTHAQRTGYDLLKKPLIIDALARRRGEMDKSSELAVTPAQRRDRIIKELERIAFADRRKAYGSDGKLKPIHEIDDDTAASIDGIETFEEFAGSGEDRELVGHVRKVRFASKIAALMALARYEGMDDPKLRLMFESDAKGKSDEAKTLTSRIEVITRVAIETTLSQSIDDEPGASDDEN